MDSIQQYGDDEDEEEAPAVILRLDGCEITSAAWCDRNEDQDANWYPGLSHENWSEHMEQEHVVAFYDRSMLDQRWRKVFVVSATENIHLFFADGSSVTKAPSNPHRLVLSVS